MTKRDEFWDTAPAFEGRPEIWDALKAASKAHESGDIELARAILTGANITTPNGRLLSSPKYRGGSNKRGGEGQICKICIRGGS